MAASGAGDGRSSTAQVRRCSLGHTPPHKPLTCRTDQPWAQAEAARTETAAGSTAPAGTGGLGRVEELREVDEAPLGSPRHPAATYPFRRVGAGPQGAVNTRPASRSAASLRLATAGSLSVFDQSQPRV